MIIPAAKLVRYASIVLLPLGTVSAMEPGMLPALAATAGIGGLISLADAAFVLRFPSSINVELPAKIRLTRNVQGFIDIVVRDEKPEGRNMTLALNLHPSIISTRPFIQVRTPGAGNILTVSWPSTASFRGLYPVKGISVRISSPLGLWQRQTVMPCKSEIAVYPNLFKERRHLAAHFLNRTGAGSHVQRPIGKGREFEKLRDYVRGDSPTDIHWKASAKRGELVTKEFMIERTQEIYVVVDASRLSGRIDRSEPGREPVLEKFITSALMLGMVAQRQGDRYGLLTFDSAILRFLRAGGGSAHFRTCRDTLFDLQPSPVTPNFDELSSFINMNLRKRSLIFLLTSLDDQALAESFERDLSIVNRRHLVIVNVLKPEHAKPVFAGDPVKRADEIYERLAGHFVFSELEELRIKLKRKGIDLYLMEEGSLSARLVSQYMEVKRRQML
jgi:uncharacterized protein (DUF58 family)